MLQSNPFVIYGYESQEYFIYDKFLAEWILRRMS